MYTDEYFYFGILLLGSAYLLLSWRSHAGWSRLLACIVMLTCVHEVSTRLLEELGVNTGIIYVLYTPLSFGLYSWIYYLLLQGRAMKIIGTIFFFATVIFGIGIPSALDTMQEFPSLTISVCSLLLIVLSMLLFIQMLNLPVEQPLSKQPIFWFNLAVIFYWCIFFARHSLFRILIEEEGDFEHWLDDLHAWMSVVYYAILVFSIWLYARQNNLTEK